MEEIKKSLFDVFAQSQETFEDAQEKSAKESQKRTEYLRFAKDGVYPVRILPLAPVMNAEGELLPMDRKGYEYPIRELVLNINIGKDKNGKEKQTYVSVCNAKYVFGDKIDNDLIDLYASVFCDLYASDQKACEKIKGGSFEGGLKYNSNRCMYVLDLNNRAEGVKIMSLSYAQYKTLEEKKLQLWKKLKEKNSATACPISSLTDAYAVEITRSTENRKTKYDFNIDVVSDKVAIEEAELRQLFEMPRLPETLYRYSRFHLEATIAFLNQYDEKMGTKVMQDQRIVDCIDQIKLQLPADDMSHFTASAVDGESGTGGSNSGITIDTLYERYDQISAEGQDDRSEAGKELRQMICDFIEDNDLDIHVSRRRTNIQLLDEIDELLSEGSDSNSKEEDDEAPESTDDGPDDASGDNEDDPDNNEDDAPAAEPEAVPSRTARRAERNDNTNEPAVRAARRARRV